MQSATGRRALSYASFCLLLAAFLCIIAIYFFNIIRWKDYPDLGFSLRSATGIHIVGVAREPGEMAGIQVGDRILDINHRTYSSIEELRQAINWEPGGENLWHIDRKGSPFYITIPNTPSGLGRSFMISGLPFFLGFCYALIGILVFLMKPHHRSSWVFLLFSFTFGLFLIYLNPLGKISPLWLENPNIYAYCFTPAVFIHLGLCFPQERKVVRKRSWTQAVPYLASGALFVAVRQTTGVMAYAPKTLQLAVVLYMVMGVLFFLGSCLQLRIASPSQVVKLRARMILLGFAISASLPLLDFVANALFKIYVLPSFGYYLPFFIAFPAFVGYSIVKHDLFDIDAIIKRTYGYLLTTGMLAGIYGIFVLISNLAFGGYAFAQSRYFALLFILAVVFFLNPIRNKVQRFIDRVFYRLEYDYRETVQKISETMRSLLKLDQIVMAMMDTALGTMFIESGCVMLFNKTKKAYECLGKTYYQVELLHEDPVIKRAKERKREITIYDVEEDSLFESDRETCRRVFQELDATLAVPLIHENDLIGMLWLGGKKSGKLYRREDINLLNTLANQSAVAIKNAILLDEVIEKERMEEELSIARDLQMSMLPASCPVLPGLQIAAHSMPAQEVGGDFFDFIEIEEGRMGLVVGDVTGKSVSGALVMSAARSVFRMLSEDKYGVAEIMVRANRRTKRDIKSGMFVALLYAVIDAKKRRLSLSSAGQTQPVYWSARTGKARLLETEGDTFPLGILDDAQYEETVLDLVSGDNILFYTDGIVEAMNEKEEIFGFERLMEVVEQAASKPADEILQDVLGAVKTFVGSARQHDDLTLIVVSLDPWDESIQT